MTINVVPISQKLVVDNVEQVVVNDVGSYRQGFHESFDVSQVSRIEVHAGAGRDVVHLLADIPSEIWGDDDNDALFAWGFSGSVGFIVHGGDGRDNIFTGDGNDTIFGDASPDEIFAHGGNDFISGGGGGDVLHGYAGRDRIYGGAGADLIHGEEGADRLYGQDGNDTIVAGGGNDILVGGAGMDVLRGERGDDVFTSNDDTEADTVIGGSGNDTGSVDQLIDSIDSVG
jgi:Ca2+-binding RTX toxin-like protein